MNTAELEIEPSNAINKKSIKTIVRLLVSVTLLIFIYRSVNFEKLYQTLSTVSINSIIMLCSLYLIGQSVSTLKWKIFLDSAGIKSDMPSIIKAYFFGMFINAFAGLGTIGGDLARSLALKPEKGFRAASLASVIADRIHGLATLLLIGSVSIAIFRPATLDNIFIVLSAFGSVALLILWLLGPRILLKIIPEKFFPLAESITQAFPSDYKKLLTAGLISLTMHCIQVTMVYIITKELKADIPLSYLFCTVPIVNAASSLPISTNGLGVRETLFYTFFSPLNVNIEQAVALGALWLIVVSLVSAVAGVILAPGLIFKRTNNE